jgi:multidrug transporter EmrE-like cation transporter
LFIGRLSFDIVHKAISVGGVMKAWVFLMGAIVSEVIATAALKSSSGFTNLLPSLVVGVGYSLSFYLLSMTLNSIPVGIAYAIWSGVGIALITFIGWFWHKQPLDIVAVIGILLILLGVLVIYFFSETNVH